MKVKNLILGTIAEVKYDRISMEDYYPSSFDETGYYSIPVGEGLFYQVGHYAFDIRTFRGYKIVPQQEKYSEKLSGRKVVILSQPFSDLTIREDISRKDAVLVYQNRRNK